MRAVRTPEEAAMRTSKRELRRDCFAVEGHEIGFELSLARPFESEQKWVVQVQHPPFPSPEGSSYSLERRPMLVTPDDGSKLDISYVIGESDRPGTYLLSVEEADTGKVLASQSFNVQP